MAKVSAKRIILIVLLVIVVPGLIGTYAILWLPNTFEGDRFIIVSKGENFQQVMDSLQREGIVRSRLLFDAAGRWLKLTTRMQIGKYRFTSGMSNTDILEDLRFGKTIETITIVIPEGTKASRQARIFSKGLGVDSARFMMLVRDTNFIHSVGIQAPSLEGYLMPDTYKLYWQMDEEDIIKSLVAEFQRVFNDTLKDSMLSTGMSLNEILTVASIVEGETSVDSERAVIAGVYFNRLRKGMRLEADPTIQYILEGGPRRLHYSDLQLESAYNTYRHVGLPPGPINNPGKASILAALRPKRHNFLFFVANGAGGHTFTRNFAAHKRAILHLRKVKEEQEAAKVAG
jgi:UPF0755 protein